MAKRTVHLHIGPPGPASDAVHDGLLQQRFALASAGFHVPATSAYDALATEIELCRTHREHGLRRSEVEGTWARLAQEAWRSSRDVLISVPGLAAAPPDGRALAFDALAGLKVHLVLTPPDPGTALTSAWSAAVRAGRRTSFAKFARRALDPTATSEHAAHFRSTYDLPTVLDAWAPRLKPARVHVITAPAQRPGLPVGPTVWQRYAALLGTDLPDRAPAGTVERETTDPGPVPALDPHDAAAHLEVLRRVNRALDGRLSHPSYAAVVAPLFGEVTRLALPDLGPDPRTAPLHDVLSDLAREWTATLLARGHSVHGAPDDLVPQVPPTAPHPDDVTTKEQLEVATDLLAEAMLDLAQLRRDNERLSATRPRRWSGW